MRPSYPAESRISFFYFFIFKRLDFWVGRMGLMGKGARTFMKHAPILRERMGARMGAMDWTTEGSQDDA